MKNNQRIWVAEYQEGKEWFTCIQYVSFDLELVKRLIDEDLDAEIKWRIVPYIRQEKRSSK